jgi:hypothetical protein
MGRHSRLIATRPKACHVLWLVYIRRYTQSQAAVIVGLNVGTVCHVVISSRVGFAGDRVATFPLKLLQAGAWPQEASGYEQNRT